MVPIYPRGIGFAFHRAGGAGREYRGHKVLIADELGLKGKSRSNLLSTRLSLVVCFVRG